MQHEAEPRLAPLVDAGIALASELDLDTLLQRIADLSRQVIRARYAAVGVVGELGELVAFFHSGIDEATVQRIGHLPRGEGLLGVVVEEGRPLRLREMSRDARSVGFPEHHPPMHSFLGVPIRARGRTFGRLYLTEKQGAEEFSKDDERLALTLAAQAGVAVENARLYEEVRRRSDELARRLAELSSFERVGRMVISEESADEVLQLAVDEARRLTGATRATLTLLDPETGALVVRNATGDQIAAELIGARLRRGTSKSHAVMARLRGETAADLSSDPEIHKKVFEQLGSPHTGAFAPLVIRGRSIGVLAAYDRFGGGTFSNDDLVVLQTLANHVTIAIENERLAEALRDLAVLEERERIAKELHDGVIQSIFSVGLSLKGSLGLLARDPERAGSRVQEAITELDGVVRDVRNYIFELRPTAVEEHGLAEAIRALARELEVNTLVQAAVELDPAACERLDERGQLQVWQVVKEIMSNIARHARASEVSVRCEALDGELVLEIEDDGVGFDPSLVVRGHGLSNIEERAEALGGGIEISPRVPRGTRHMLRIPYHEPGGNRE